MKISKIRFEAAIKRIFDTCRDLSELSGGIRKFTPDGRMVGDIGEVYAANFYRVKLHKEGRHDWDGNRNGRNVQIKATSGKGTYLKKPPNEGFGSGILMVFHIDKENGKCTLAYDGKIQRVWDSLKNLEMDKTGAKMISLKQLKELAEK